MVGVVGVWGVRGVSGPSWGVRGDASGVNEAKERRLGVSFREGVLLALPLERSPSGVGDVGSSSSTEPMSWSEVEWDSRDGVCEKAGSDRLVDLASGDCDIV